jgi:Electron transfer DM13
MSISHFHHDATYPRAFARISFYLLSAVVMAAVLSACGGGGSEQAVAASTAPVTTTATVVATTPATPATPGTLAACEKTNAKVDQVATLSTRSHGVSGKVVVVDNCTLQIRNFNYDGGGLSKVFVYGGKAGNYVAGFPVGNNLRGTSFANQTLTVTLSAGDLDKMDGISVWCADANANFGDGVFAPVAPV